MKRNIIKREFEDFVQAILDVEEGGWKEFSRPSIVVHWDEVLGRQTNYIIYLALKGDTPLIACGNIVEVRQVNLICKALVPENPNFWCLFDTWGGLMIGGAKNSLLIEPTNVSVNTLSIINA